MISIGASRGIPTGNDTLNLSNAFSVSKATGIPRETVRRRVDKLVKKGWLAKNAKGEIAITDAVRRKIHARLQPESSPGNA